MQFIFGEGTDTPDAQTLARRRAIADKLAAGSLSIAPRNLGEGLTAVGMALAGRMKDKKLQGQEQAERQRIAAMLSGGGAPMAAGGGAIMGGGGSGPAPMRDGPNQGIADEAMAAVGRAPVQQGGALGVDFGAIEGQYGLPSGYLARTAQIESSFNPNAKNPNSSATGLFQFINSTARQYGLENPLDPVASSDAAARLARDNAATLRSALGRDPSPAELYLAHQQGGGGAARLLSNPNARAADIVGAEAVRLNGGNLDMTAGQFAQLWLTKFGGGGGSPAPAQGGQPAPQMNMQQFAEIMGNPYATEGQRAVAQAMLNQQMQAADPMRQLQMQKMQAEIAQIGQPQQTQLPAAVVEAEWRAEQAGLQPGTPEYQDFIRMNGVPGNFAALDMQARSAGMEPGSPEYQQFMATRGAGEQALARGMGANQADIATGGEAARVRAAGAAQGAADISSRSQVAEMQRNMPNLLALVDRLDTLAGEATYGLVGRGVDAARRAAGMEVSPGGIARAEYTALVDNQILPLLRQTFGAAFTEAEGARLRATLGNDEGTPAEKRATLQAFIQQKQRELEALGGQMPPSGSGANVDFSTMPMEGMVEIDTEGMTLEQLRAYNARIRELQSE
jgi:hypothetical protein